MQTTNIKPGDVLDCEVRAQSFFARATSSVASQNDRRGVHIEPLRPGTHLPALFVTARQIRGHYTKRKGSR